MAHAARAAFLGGAGADDYQVRALAIGDVGFAARQSPAIAVLPRDRFHPLQIAPRAWFGHRDRADRGPRDHPGEEALFLLLAAVMDDVIGDDVRLQGEARGRAHVAQFLADDRVEREIEPWPAISFGHLRT